ncbi:autotransporter outer membrane beta-barrel domain-containing protein [Ferrovibrio sp. MS7]|uniref:autotransporter outer membrane beta-barrel domain-containing protein n=1 Tax=Ferrovibrio plantarum TaxID=3119164 RepID=UPI003134DAA8
MIRKIAAARFAFGVLTFGLVAGGLFAAAPAFAASDVSNSGAVANQAVTAVAAPIASAQTASLISGAIGGAISGGIGGGFTGGGTGGGFSPSGGATPGPISMNGRDSGRAAGSADKKFGTWMQGSYASVENSQAGLQMDGNVYNVVGGLDYKLSDRALIGVSLGYENLDLTTTFNNGSTKSDGLSIIPYFGFQLNNTWSISASGGYGMLNYDVVRNTNVRGSYDAERWFVSGNLNGAYGFGRWRLMPTVGVMYLEEKSDAYTESTGGLVGSSTTKLGRVTFGGNVGYAFEKVMPYVKLVGEYDFEKNAPVALGNGTFSNDDELGAQIGLGINFFGLGSFSGNVEGAYLSAGRQDLDVWSVSARLRATF